MKAALVAAVLVMVLAGFIVSADCNDRSMPRPGGTGYVQCRTGLLVVNGAGEVTKCILAVPLTYDVYGGTDVCPAYATVTFDYKGRVVGCTTGKKGKR